MSLRQLCVELENQPGRLCSVSEAFAAAGISIRVMMLSENEQAGAFRMLVSDLEGARRVVMEMQLPARIEEVIALRIPDEPGSLAGVLKPLWEQYINVLHMYAFPVREGKSLTVFRFSDPDKALEILAAAGLQPVEFDDLRKEFSE